MTIIDKERFNLAIYKSVKSIEEMMSLRDEYVKLRDSYDLYNSNEKIIEDYKKKLDKLLKHSFYNIDMYYFEFSVLVGYLRGNLLDNKE